MPFFRSYKRFLIVSEDFVRLQYRADRKLKKEKKQRRQKKGAGGSHAFEIPAHLLQLSRAAIQSLCRVLVARPYFNFRDKLAAIIVNNLVNKDDVISNKCYDCLKQVYKEDTLGRN